MIREFAGIISILFFVPFLAAQDYPKDYFSSPVDTTISLSGNFGELRPNHFHSGLDVRTRKQGLKIYSSADGYVSRIKVSTTGYGKVLYITHPNGYSTVYAHLSKFNGKIDSFVKASQYQEETFEIELFPYPQDLIVKKGEIIAFSGNTGGSSGPHLHYEIRKANNDVPVNPLLFGIKIQDHRKPGIRTLAVYPLSDESHVNNSRFTVKKIVRTGKTKYYLLKKDSLWASGPIGFGLEVYDREDRGTSDNAVYGIELKANGKVIYSHEMEKFPFSESRYINAHMDYYEKERRGKKIQRSFLLENDKLSIYRQVDQKGILFVHPDSVYRMEYRVYDVFGNTSSFDFVVKGKKGNSGNSRSGQKNVSSKEAFVHESDELKVFIPAFSLYEDTPLSFLRLKSKSLHLYSPLYSVGSRYVPLHDAIQLKIRVKNIHDSLGSKLVIVSHKNGKVTSEGGTYHSGWIETKVKSFGVYGVEIDSTAPVLRFPYKITTKPKGVPQETAIIIKRNEPLRIYAVDNLTGIAYHYGKLDGKWVLTEYEPKEKMIFMETENLLPGKHEFYLKAKDYCGNLRELRVLFYCID